MEPSVWQLLYMYTYLLNAKARAQKRSRITTALTIGGIVSRFLIAQRNRIIDEYKALRTRELIKVAGSAVPQAALLALLSEVPKSRRDRDDDPSDPAAKAPIGFVHEPARGPKPTVRRRTSEPGEVRPVDIDSAGFTGEGYEDLTDSLFGGDDSLGLGGLEFLTELEKAAGAGG